MDTIAVHSKEINVLEDWSNGIKPIKQEPHDNDYTPTYELELRETDIKPKYEKTPSDELQIEPKRKTSAEDLQNMVNYGENDLKIITIECDVCGMSFNEKFRSIRNKRARYEPLECDKCKTISENCKINYDALTKSNSHEIIHNEKEIFNCDLCKKRFTRKSNLVKHKESHTGKKTVGCDICKKGFTRKSTLVLHIRGHTGEKPFKCEICKKTFKQKDYLVAHKRVHTGEKPYECNVCKKKFALKTNLNSHKRAHFGEKPFECDLCEKRFVRRLHLVKHKQRHTSPGSTCC